MPSSEGELIGGRPTRRSPETTRLYELLADGEWHYVRDVVSEMARKVDPHKATRAVETNRVSRTNGGPEARLRELSVEAQVASGKKYLANASLRSAASRGVLEFKDQQTDKPQVRLAYRYRLWTTARMAHYLGRLQGTVQAWARDERIRDEVREFLPEGVEPTVQDPAGFTRWNMFDPKSGPAWRAWAERRDALGDDRTRDKHHGILTAVRKALGLSDTEEDTAEALAVAGRLRKELDKFDLYIAVRQRSKLAARDGSRDGGTRQESV